MRVKPVDPSAKIRDPHTKQPLPKEGGDVPDNSFWNRRLLAGEVVRVSVVEPESEVKAAAESPEPAPPEPPEPAPPVGNEPLAPLTTRRR